MTSDFTLQRAILSEQQFYRHPSNWRVAACVNGQRHILLAPSRRRRLFPTTGVHRQLARGKSRGVNYIKTVQK